MDKDAAREGLRSAVQMIGTEAKAIWDSFRSMLAANAVLIGLLGAVLKLYAEMKPLAVFLAIVGIVICFAWMFITMRSFASFKYWIAWARKYEQIALGTEEGMFQQGRRFAEGETAKGLDQSESRMIWGGRMFKIQWLSYTVEAAFLVVYVFGLVVTA